MNYTKKKCRYIIYVREFTNKESLQKPYIISFTQDNQNKYCKNNKQ